MSSPEVSFLLELHLFSAQQSPELVDLLTAVAHYHQTEYALGLDHTVNFGTPWLSGSACCSGLVLLPYLDGPTLEKMAYQSREVHCLWLVPIIQAERDFKAAHGVEALEDLFEEAGLDYLNATQPSVAEHPLSCSCVVQKNSGAFNALRAVKGGY